MVHFVEELRMECRETVNMLEEELNTIRYMIIIITNHTGNEGPVRIQYKCLVPIYVFPEMKLCSLVLKQNYNVMSPNSYTHISVRGLYISRIGLSILLYSQICGPILGREYINRSQTHECRNWD